MTGKDRHHHGGRPPDSAVQRQSTEHRAHTDKTSTAIRLVPVICEITWDLVREYVLQWPTGPRRPL